MKTITETELKSILDQHKLWSETLGEEGICANLEGVNLEFADLEGVNLEGAWLKGASLNCVNLEGANLEGADLTDSDLYYANLSDANLLGANLTGANLECASLECAILTGAKLRGANLNRVDLKNTIGLPDISWIIPSCLVQLNRINYGFYLVKERKHDNFIQDSFGFIIQNNAIEKTFDMLVEDRIIRGIPDWVKYSGLKQAATESV